MANPDPCPTYESVISCKDLPIERLNADLNKLINFKAEDNPRSFYGNPVLYHYQMRNLVNCKVRNGSFTDIHNDLEKRRILWDNCHKYARNTRLNNPPSRMFEMYRRLNGAVVFFKPTTAMYLYKRFKATSILDPTAGWGGRLLGAWALGIPYTGIDTNVNLIPAYDGISQLLNDHPHKGSDCEMLWEDCLQVDFSKINYDFVLTSPPYINLELYENMTPYESDKAFYQKFLIPLLDKCLRHIKNSGYVCFNISPKMYKDLIKFGYKECEMKIDLLQQKIQGKDKGDKIYCWC